MKEDIVLQLTPEKVLFSKGSVIIEDNVWLGGVTLVYKQLKTA
jgi:hypothetical protein